MTLETVTMDADGVRYNQWESVEVVAAFNQVAVTFRIRTTEAIEKFTTPFAQWAFPPGTSIQLRAGGDLMCDGFVDVYEPSAAATFHEIMVTGQSKSGDLGDCSPFHASGLFEEQSLFEIAKALASPFNVAVKVAGIAGAIASAPIPIFATRKGSTVWYELIRLCSAYGCTLMGDVDGSVLIVRGSLGVHSGLIVQGSAVNGVSMERMSARLDGRARYSNYECIGQCSTGTEDYNFFGNGTAEDPAVKRFRFWQQTNAENSTPPQLRAQARWLMLSARGMACQAHVTVPGFRDVAGKLWTPGFRVFVHSAWLKLSQPMVILRTTFRKDLAGGTRTELDLADPATIGDEGEFDGDSGPEWG